MPASQPFIVPPSRPQVRRADFEARINHLRIDAQQYPLVVAGLRGYYAQTMGGTPGNDRGVYDDAIVLYAPTLDVYQTFNGNTDPTRVRRGHGTAEATRGMASLSPGIWYAYRFDVHGGSKPHDAICQRAGHVTVIRDGDPPYAHTGAFGINIHRGGKIATSSEGCQTIPPSQWDEFIGAAQQCGQRLFGSAWKQRTVAYALVDWPDQTGQTTPTANPLPEQARRFAELVIRPTLQTLGYWSPAAEELLLGTALVESALTQRVQREGGSARGLFQMTPKTHDDIWLNYLNAPAKLSLTKAIEAQLPHHGASLTMAGKAAALERNDAYACAMARAHYLRVPARLPEAGDLPGQAAYWKRHYNTPAGAGTEVMYVQAWQQARA